MDRIDNDMDDDNGHFTTLIRFRQSHKLIVICLKEPVGLRIKQSLILLYPY